MLTPNFTFGSVTGYVYATVFNFTDSTVSTNPIVSRFWDFGDGHNAYNDISVNHIYDYPGTYNVTLLCTDSNGVSGQAVYPFIVDYFVRDRIEITQIPSVFSNPGVPTPSPFKVSVTSAQINQPLNIQLHSANSKSTPYHMVPEKWSFLTPTWRFTDKDFNVISVLSVPPQPIYHGGSVVGVYGEAEFYYIDDLGIDLKSGDCALLLSVTLIPSGFVYPGDSTFYQYHSYANSKVTYATTLWQVNDLAPDYLRVTGNYLDEIHPTKWANVKIPALITVHSYQNTYQLLTGSNRSSGILFSYPVDNIYGKNHELVLTLSGVPASAYKVDEAPLYFQATDSNNQYHGGYVFTTITPYEPIAYTAIVATITAAPPLTASTFPSPIGHPTPPHVWVSNPEHNKLHRITVVPPGISCSATNYFYNISALNDGAIYSSDVPYITASNTTNYGLTGFSGIYGMAVDMRNQSLIAVDAESDTIFKYSSNGTLLSAISLRVSGGNLQAVNGLNLTTSASSSLVIGYNTEVALTPSYVCMDKNYNSWISFYNSVSVLKFDKDLNFLLAAAPPSGTYTLPLCGEFLFKPPVVETDLYNNIWVTYSQSLCSALYKYDEFGNNLTQVHLPSTYCPIGLAIAPTNNIWVTNSLNVTQTGGNIQQYDTNGTLLTTITGFARPSYISLDNNANVWFSHGFREIGFINKNTYATSSWNLTNTGNFTVIPIPDPSIPVTFNIDEEIGGLTVDALNRLWVIDSQGNMAYMTSADPVTISTATTRGTKILPDSNIGFIPSGSGTFTMVVTSTFYKSAQAMGDWSGNRWLQKYGSSPNTLIGVSAPFTVYDYDTTFRFKKINENFNNSEYYKSLALPETLKSNEDLFDKFFAAAVGTAIPDKNEDIGEKVYERIANYVIQHADVDTCSVDQLLSHCDSVDLHNYRYSVDYPAEITRLLDIFSVPKEKLRGVRDRLPVISECVGSSLNTYTATITAGHKIFLQSIFTSTYTLITVPQLSGLMVYPLSSLEGTGFVQPVTVNYLFFEYVPHFPVNEETGGDVYIENIIDWSNKYTTLKYELSTYKEWYDVDGLVEKSFNYFLTKNIFNI